MYDLCTHFQATELIWKMEDEAVNDPRNFRWQDEVARDLYSMTDREHAAVTYRTIYWERGETHIYW